MNNALLVLSIVAFFASTLWLLATVIHSGDSKKALIPLLCVIMAFLLEQYLIGR